MGLTPPEYYEGVADEIEHDMPEAATILRKIANEVRAIGEIMERHR